MPIEVNMKELAKFLCDKHKLIILESEIQIQEYIQFTYDVEYWVYKQIPTQHILEDSQLTQILNDLDSWIRAELIQRLMNTFQDYQIIKEK